MKNRNTLSRFNGIGINIQENFNQISIVEIVDALTSETISRLFKDGWCDNMYRKLFRKATSDMNGIINQEELNENICDLLNDANYVTSLLKNKYN